MLKELRERKASQDRSQGGGWKAGKGEKEGHSRDGASSMLSQPWARVSGSH